MAGFTQMGSPQTPGSARKAPSLKSKGSKGSGAGTKRAAKTEDSSPSQAKPRKKKVEKSAAAQVSPNKKQKAQKNGSCNAGQPKSNAHHLLSTLDANGYPHIPIPTPSQTSVQSFQAAQPFPPGQNLRINTQVQPNSNKINPSSSGIAPATPTTPHNFNAFFPLLITLVKNTSSLLPSTNPLISSHIDAITYALWTACLTHDNSALLNLANQYGAMLTETKLRLLACMGFLPSWWFLREQVVLVTLKKMGRTTDDEIMNGWAAEAARQTARRMTRMERAKEEKEEK